MSRRFAFDEKEAFLKGLVGLIQSGVPRKDLTILLPHPVHEAFEILSLPRSNLRVFTLTGGVLGLITGFAFTIYTALSWPLITGGKPIVSIPPFVIIAFALTILFGSLASFFGFLILSRLPSPVRIVSPEECGNQFVVIVESEEP